MGEIADAMIDGTFCQECGDYLGEGPGFGRICSGCHSDRIAEKSDRVERDRAAFPAMRTLAKQHGLELTRHNDGWQYNLRRPGLWILQYYPTNGRLYSPRDKRGPYLGILGEVTLEKVVRGAIEKESA